MNDGVRSVWNGQSPFQFSPARFEIHELPDELDDVHAGADVIEDVGAESRHQELGGGRSDLGLAPAAATVAPPPPSERRPGAMRR